MDEKYKFIKRGNVELVNFVCLSESQLRTVLNWRNHPRVNRWLIDRRHITWEQHLAFVEKLRTSDNTFYWLTKCRGEECGVVSLIIDKTDNSGTPGIFLAPELVGTGIGVEIGYEARHINFEYIQVSALHGLIYKQNKNAVNTNLLAGYRILTYNKEMVKTHMIKEDNDASPADFADYLKLIRNKEYRRSRLQVWEDFIKKNPT